MEQQFMTIRQTAQELGIPAGFIRKEEKANFDIRWKKQRAIPIEKQSPELRTGSIVYRMLLLFSIALGLES